MPASRGEIHGHPVQIAGQLAQAFADQQKAAGKQVALGCRVSGQAPSGCGTHLNLCVLEMLPGEIDLVTGNGHPKGLTCRDKTIAKIQLDFGRLFRRQAKVQENQIPLGKDGILHRPAYSWIHGGRLSGTAHADPDGPHDSVAQERRQENVSEAQSGRRFQRGGRRLITFFGNSDPGLPVPGEITGPQFGSETEERSDLAGRLPWKIGCHLRGKESVSQRPSFSGFGLVQRTVLYRQEGQFANLSGLAFHSNPRHGEGCLQWLDGLTTPF